MYAVLEYVALHSYQSTIHETHPAGAGSIMQSASFAVTTLIACGMIVLLLFSTDFRFLPSTSIRPPTTGYSSQISYVGSLESDIYNSTLGVRLPGLL